jgi:hypothetical protein
LHVLKGDGSPREEPKGCLATVRLGTAEEDSGGKLNSKRVAFGKSLRFSERRVTGTSIRPRKG